MKTTVVSGIDLFIVPDDVKICYDDMGTGDTPIIFIHGFPFDKSMWQPQMQELSQFNRVIAYDIRGYGKSEGGDQPLSINLFATDLVDFMEALQIDKAIICGLSMGGYIAMNAISRNAERFAALVLSDTQCIADSDTAKEGRKKGITLVKSGGIVDFTEAFVGKIFTADTLENNEELVEKITNLILLTDPDIITGSLTALAEREEMCTRLNKISVPTLILCGDADVVTPMEQSSFLKNSITGATLEVIPEAGHLSNLEQPEVFNAHLKNFVSGLGA